MKFEEVLKLYIEDILEHNKAGISIKLEDRASRIFPQRFSYVKDEHPYDLNYNERKAYYHGLEYAYKDILEKIKSMIEQQ